MSSRASSSTTAVLPPVDPPARKRGWGRRSKAPTHISAHGEPMVWLTGGAMSFCLLMIVGLLALIFCQGVSTFWPLPLEHFTLADGTVYLGEVSRRENYVPDAKTLAALPPANAADVKKFLDARSGTAVRTLLRTGNFELTQTHFHWVDDFLIKSQDQRPWDVLFERVNWGRFYGTPVALRVDGKAEGEGTEAAWHAYEKYHDQVRARWHEQTRLERVDSGHVSQTMQNAKLEVVRQGIDHGKSSPEHAAAQAEYDRLQSWATAENTRIAAKIEKLRSENNRYQLLVRAADGREQRLALADIVRAYPANQLSLLGKLAVYGSRWWEFLTDEPREANTEGGVFPAIFGTVVMTLLMTVAVVPFGVLAALYLREYAKAGLVISIVRIAVNNLAGVPSIVFGVFGYGFFCLLVGGTIDQMFFYPSLAEGNKPTFGTGGVLWASLTLALLTLPVVIVATEEALAAVPRSMREGSYACGASKWQTIWHIVLPRALPGMMTGTILAMARGAGEVAPLMLVGAVKIAPSLLVDGVFPYVHAQRAFMHLGFHIYDVGFQSANSEAARPMVYTTTLLLITIVATLNLTAIWLRARLRRQYVSSHF
ncbi:MAG: phosphate ABC transporter permease PstA [Planctomycetes bacterium]|nr:phosphate ABC transporter permease PstA [Planctomycetota bacterium]